MSENYTPPRCKECPLSTIEELTFRRNCKGPASTEIDPPSISHLKKVELRDGTVLAIDDSDNNLTYTCESPPLSWNSKEGTFDSVQVLGSTACRNPAVKIYIEDMV